MILRSFLILGNLLLPLTSFAWSGVGAGRSGGGSYSSAVAMSSTMARNTMIVIGIAAFIVFLYGIKYWKKRR